MQNIGIDARLNDFSRAAMYPSEHKTKLMVDSPDPQGALIAFYIELF
jgi:hypothetical protein